MEEQRITFSSGELKLEGLLAKPSIQGASHAGVVCHPHPLYGGSMYNNVVDAVLAAMWSLGWPTLRFNFRGVGGSEGNHSGGAGEADDAAAAVEFAARETGLVPDNVVLAGYSFGAIAAINGARKFNRLGGLALIGLPLTMADSAGLADFAGPVFLVAGDNDPYCPAQRLAAVGRDLGERASLQTIEGAGHFFGGYETALTGVLGAMLKTV